MFPEAGDEFNAVKEDKVAREIAENRKMKLREEVLARNAKVRRSKLSSVRYRKAKSRNSTSSSRAM